MSIIVSTTTTAPRTYTDLNLSFVTNPFTRDITKKTNEDAIKFAIMNLIMTRKYERPFHPEISSDVQELLFENYTIMTRPVLKRSIENVVHAFEPRARIIDVLIDGSNYSIDKNEVTITIIFTMLNSPKPVTFNVTLNRVR